MLLLKYVMLIVGAGVSLGAAAIVAYDIYMTVSYQRLMAPLTTFLCLSRFGGPA